MDEFMDEGTRFEEMFFSYGELPYLWRISLEKDFLSLCLSISLLPYSVCAFSFQSYLYLAFLFSFIDIFPSCHCNFLWLYVTTN